MLRGSLTTHVWRPALASRHSDRQALVRSASTRHECQCAIGDEVAIGIRCVTFGCHLDLVLLWIRLQINKIKASYITIHKVYFIFWKPFKFAGPMLSHGPHGPRDAPGECQVFYWRIF